jgi:hypothetical protein
MIRRILILVASFLALLGCFFTYQRICAMPRESAVPRTVSAKPPAVLVSLIPTSKPAKAGAPEFGPGANLHVEARDKYNHLQYVLESPKWNREPDGSWSLEKPVVTMYQKGGMVIGIRGESGSVFAEEVKSNVKINSGSLRGNVEISIDRNSIQAAPIAQRPKDLILIKMDDVSFDNNRLEISTPNEVRVTSYEADIDGKGLTISLNESPSELRLLRLEQGRMMTIREEGLTLSTPGGNASGPKAVPTTGPAMTVAADVAAQGTLEKLKGQTAQDEAIELEAILPQPTADQGKTDNSGKKIPPARNIYLAQFDSPDNHLDVISANGTLQNANKVTMLFEWGGQPKRSGDSTSPSAASPRSMSPAVLPPGKERKPTVITWSGPLELRPVGYLVKPNKKKYEVHAQGPQLTIADKQSTVNCGEVFFHQPGQTGELLGNGSKQVSMTLSSGETILADSVLFDRVNGVADLVGKGTITQPYRGGSEIAIGGAAPTAAASAPSQHAPDDFIQWTKSVAVLFGESRAPDAAAGRLKQYVKEATFYGHVELHRPANGDFMQCEDNLHVLMARVEGGKNTLQRAVATGDVKAHYEKSDIEGQKLVMDFEAVKKGVGKIQNRPATFEITGGVIVRTRDAKDPKNDSVVNADRIHANVINQTAELYGNPAVMVQDQKKVTGNEIRVVAGDRQVGTSRVRELMSAQVVGPGTADFPNDRDPLSGTRFSQPKLTHVTWAQSMNFDGIANTLDVNGDVHLDSELDKMRCQTVHLDFDRTAKSGEASPEEASTEPAAGKNLALGIGKFGTRQLARIDAEGKVKVDSRSTDKEGHLIQLLDLNCANLIYTAKEKTMIVDGAGNMLVGDFRQPPPVKKAPATESDMTPPVEDVQRPSASAFEWQKRMTLTQHDDGERTVQLEGDVVLVHRSGLQVELTDQQKKQWSVADWHDLRPGRHIVLGCDDLQAAFDKPAEKGKPAADPTQQGPRVGNLRNFQALKDVNLKDGQFQVLGQRLIYDVRDKDGKMVDVVKIFGYMEGQKKTLAQIISANPQTGRMQQQQAPEITWNRKDNSIETKDVNVVGGR